MQLSTVTHGRRNWRSTCSDILLLALRHQKKLSVCLSSFSTAAGVGCRTWAPRGWRFNFKWSALTPVASCSAKRPASKVPKQRLHRAIRSAGATRLMRDATGIAPPTSSAYTNKDPVWDRSYFRWTAGKTGRGMPFSTRTPSASDLRRVVQPIDFRYYSTLY